MFLKKKRRKLEELSDEEIAIEFMKTAIKINKKMGLRIIGIRKA
ncbi:hypothetical protein [Ureibacillus chungkukjangi]|nr:hypothetical protein [Ureibacillus chungkukjangi]